MIRRAVKSRACLVFLGFVLFCAPVLSFAGDSQGQDFPSSREWKKLDSVLQNGWTQAKAGGTMDARVDCFVRVDPPADPGDRAFLETHGFVVRTFAGLIASGHTTYDSLQGIANLDFVQGVRAAK
jgi:hypothetical protein